MRSLTKAERLNEMKRLYVQRAFSDIEMGERLGVRRETVFRDRKELETEYPFIQLENGRWKIDRTRFISEIKVNLHEALTLYLAARKASRQTKYHHPHTVSAMEKLAGALYQPMAERLIQSANQLINQEKAPERTRILELIAQSWAEQKKLQIKYQRLGSEGFVDHIICPYIIEPSIWSDSLYVIALSNVTKNLVSFRVDRIHTARKTNETYEIPADFDENTLLKYAWGIWYGDKAPITVRLRFSKAVTRRVKESIWHPLEHTEDTPDGGCLWQADVAEWREMLPWIRGWGSDVEVMAPDDLRKELEQEAQRMARVYGVDLVTKNTIKYYAHSKDNVKESNWQLLKDHLQETGKLAFDLGADAGISELAYTAGIFHDIGKYSEEFQSRLRGNKKHVDHSTAGAREILKLFPDSPQKDFAMLISYCIAGHHAGLPDFGSKGDVETDGTLLARIEKKKIKDYDSYKKEINSELLIINPRTIHSAIFRHEQIEITHTGFSISFLCRMLFSTLVDADWLETERFYSGDKKLRGQHASIEMLTKQFNSFLEKFSNPKNEINRKRTEILNACIEKSSQKPGFFKLTVPTGGGKTHASMAFALNHAVKHGLKRIIYVIPFTSIIEQNARVFIESFGQLGTENVLEHHSNFDWNPNQNYVDDETNRIEEKLKLAMENWDVPVVVTTNVQFFESIFANKKQVVRKLHNIAKSVIIFDEAQMIPRDYLKPCLLAVQELVRNYGSTAVFCTATQPSLEQFFSTNTDFTELVPDTKKLFDFYRRIQLNNLGILEDEDILSKINKHNQVLCVVNTRKHARGLFLALEGKENFHLSTLMCPKHRENTMKEIHRRLGTGQICRVISTQVIEAGIDVDFPVGYRAMAGLDSIIQAAGRVNREGTQKVANVFVFYPKTPFIKRTPVFIKQTSSVTESILCEYKNDPVSYASIQSYYKKLYSLQSEQSFDMKNIIGHFDKNNGELDFDFKSAAENFKLIENNTVSIIIPFDDKAEHLIEELTYSDYPISTIRNLQSYIVNVYENEFLKIQGKGVIQTIDDRYHILDKKWMGDDFYYHSKTGMLLPEWGNGEAIFFD